MVDTIGGEMEQFCYSVLDRLNTTKATIELCEKDIIKNCNTSIFKAFVLMNEEILLLYSKKTPCHFLIQEAWGIIDDIKRKLLAPYGEHFSSWFEYNIVKAGKENPDFYNDLYCIQKLEKDYPFYDKMYVAFKECQELFIEFKNRLELYLKTYLKTNEG